MTKAYWYNIDSTLVKKVHTDVRKVETVKKLS